MHSRTRSHTYRHGQRSPLSSPLKFTFKASIPSPKLYATAPTNQANPDNIKTSIENTNGLSPTIPPADTDVPTQPTSASPQPKGARVHVNNIVKHYKTRRGLFKGVDGASIVLQPGTITALLGPSGSGKTTLLRLIAGLEDPTSGRIIFDDEDVTDVPIQSRNVGVVFQGYALFKHMTVSKNIAFGPKIRKLDGDLETRVNELLHLIELAELGGRYPPQLSGGQKQRVALARALACNPRILLLDEPFGALDPLIRKSLRLGLQSIVRRLGVTTIMVTHDQEEAWDIADHVVVFNHGKVQQEGTPQELARNPASPFVMNFVGDVVHLPSTCVFVRKMGLDPQGKSHVMVRPKDLEVMKEFTHPYICGAIVADKANVGFAVRYWIKFDDGIEVEWGVGRKEDALYDLSIGQRVFLRADPSKMMAFDYSEISDPASMVFVPPS